MDLNKLEQAFQDIHNNNPPYTFIKSTWGVNFFYDNSPIFFIFLCSEYLGYRITSALNAAYLEGWIRREKELEEELRNA